MLLEISQTLSLLKTAGEIIKGLNSLKNKIAVNEIKLELTNIIISLQSNAVTMNEKYNEIVSSKYELEKKLAELRQYKNQKENYVLKEISIGIFAYVLKEKENSSNNIHWLCQNCLDNSQKFSIYQRHHDEYYSCPHCGNRIFPKSNDEDSANKFSTIVR